MIGQGDDGGVNATNLRRLIADSAGCDQTTDSRSATIIQTRHRVPEQVLGCDHILVLQVPVPEPLRGVQRAVTECARMHAEADYSTMWVSLYEDLVRNGVISRSTGYPVLVGGRYVMATTRLVTALASDYLPFGLLAAVFLLAEQGIATLPEAVGLVTSGPARVAGLTDRGALVEGLRADLVLVQQGGTWPVVRAVLRAE